MLGIAAFFVLASPAPVQAVETDSFAFEEIPSLFQLQEEKFPASFDLRNVDGRAYVTISDTAVYGDWGPTKTVKLK